jgi:guanylate kinase
MECDAFSPRESPPLLLVISGSSGAGKDAVIERMKELRLPFRFVVTTTTRDRRINEIEAIHYNFVPVEDFHQMVADGEMLEWAKVYDNYYGVPRKAVREALGSGRDVVVKVDVQGAATIRRCVPGATLIFIRPPSMEELERRLRSRRTETPETLAIRLGKAAGEYGELHLFDYVLINRPGRIDDVVQQIRAIVTAEKCRVSPKRVEL